LLYFHKLAQKKKSIHSGIFSEFLNNNKCVWLKPLCMKDKPYSGLS